MEIDIDQYSGPSEMHSSKLRPPRTCDHFFCDRSYLLYKSPLGHDPLHYTTCDHLFCLVLGTGRCELRPLSSPQSQAVRGRRADTPYYTAPHTRRCEVLKPVGLHTPLMDRPIDKSIFRRCAVCLVHCLLHVQADQTGFWVVRSIVTCNKCSSNRMRAYSRCR